MSFLAAEESTGAGLVLLLVILVFGLLAYFAPTIIAAARSHHNLGSILVINLLLGWTFLGWVVSLAMAVSAIRPPER